MKGRIGAVNTWNMKAARDNRAQKSNEMKFIRDISKTGDYKGWANILMYLAFSAFLSSPVYAYVSQPDAQNQ